MIGSSDLPTINAMTASSALPTKGEQPKEPMRQNVNWLVNTHDFPSNDDVICMLGGGNEVSISFCFLAPRLGHFWKMALDCTSSCSQQFASFSCERHALRRESGLPQEGHLQTHILVPRALLHYTRTGRSDAKTRRMMQPSCQIIFVQFASWSAHHCFLCFILHLEMLCVNVSQAW